jgi:hypothetical protein
MGGERCSAISAATLRPIQRREQFRGPLSLELATCLLQPKHRRECLDLVAQLCHGRFLFPRAPIQFALTQSQNVRANLKCLTGVRLVGGIAGHFLRDAMSSLGQQLNVDLHLILTRFR